MQRKVVETRSEPAESGATPRVPPRSHDPLHWLLGLIVLLFCGAVAALLVTHESGDRREVGVVREFRLARINIARAYLHISLGAPDSPQQRAQGIALLTPEFFADELASGRLVCVSDIVYRMDQSYWLAYRADRAKSPKIRAFRDWILAEVAKDCEVSHREQHQIARM